MSEQNKEIEEKWAQLQLGLKKQLITENKFDWTLEPGDKQIQYIGGIDISYEKEDDSKGCIALIVLSYPSLEIVYRDYQKVVLDQPYIPSYLAFREIDHLIAAIDRLKKDQPDLLPQVLLIDGNGLLHPRGFGLACHVGVMTNIPTIGVGKNFFVMDGLGMLQVKELSMEKCPNKGDSIDLVGDSGVTHGAAMSTSDGGRRPIYISIGHMIDLPTAVNVVRACCRHRIPEPIRQADLGSREFLRGGDVNRKF